jgi:hypothetical protein
MTSLIIADLEHTIAPAGSGGETLNPGVVLIAIAIGISIT